jgi:hypothetical protein
VTGQKGRGQTEESQCNVFGLLSVDVDSVECQGSSLEVIPDITVNSLHQSELGIDAQQNHRKEEDKEPEVSHRKQK